MRQKFRLLISAAYFYLFPTGNEKVDRQAAIQKISDTFGYGEGRKANHQKVSKVLSFEHPNPESYKVALNSCIFR